MILTKDQFYKSIAVDFAKVVDSTYQDLIKAAVLAEREACAQIAAEWLGPVRDRELHIAEAIRARGKE